MRRPGPVHSESGRAFCLNTPGAELNGNGTGVSFQDITPRCGVAWDVFGNGRTALKFNMGKYVGGAQVGGIYTASNLAGAGRFQSTFIRQWTDPDGDRHVEGCDLLVPEVAPPSSNVAIPGSGECGAIPTAGSATASSVATYRRFGRSPGDTDASGLTTGLGNIQCGRKESALIPTAALAYCDDYFAAGGGSMLNGWNRRQYEWQFGVGVQHEMLPRLSAEVTYNRRSSHNLTITDDVGVGCDLYGPTANNPDDCMARLLNWDSQWYDFYGVRAPLDVRLPNGGGYLIPGFADRKPGVTIPSANQVNGRDARQGRPYRPVLAWRRRQPDVARARRAAGHRRHQHRRAVRQQLQRDGRPRTSPGPGPAAASCCGRARSAAARRTVRSRPTCAARRPTRFRGWTCS